MDISPLADLTDAGIVEEIPETEIETEQHTSTFLSLPKEAIREIMLAKIRAAFATGYAYRLSEGWTIEQMCTRVGWTERQFRSNMLVHSGISLSTIGVFALALDLELDIKLVPRGPL